MKKKSTVTRQYQKARRALETRRKEFTQREKDMLYGAYMALDWVLDTGYWTPKSWLDKWEPRP